MTPTPIFAGRVTGDGRPTVFDRSGFREYVRSLAGKEIEFIVRPKRSQRSLDQNAYAHAVPFPMIAEEWGEDIETTKLLLLGECFGWRETRDGQRVPVKPSTSRLTVDEFSHFITWMVEWAAMPGNVCAMGFRIPLPNEVEP